MLEQLQYYLIPTFACICFLFFIYAGKTTAMKAISNYFIVGTIVILSVIAAEIGEIFFATPYVTYVNWQRWVCSIIAYILRPGIAYLLLVILFRNREKTILFSCLMVLPLAVNAIFLLVSPLCGIVYKFDAGNHYTGGPLKYLPFVIGFVYLMIFLTFFGLDARKNGNVEWIVSIPVICMCGLSVYLESECNLLGSLPTACIVGMIFYYIYFYMDYYVRDSLTGAYQRSMFYHDISREGFRYFIIFDVNGLKRINDNMGHLCGDNALNSFAQCALSVLPPKARLYRIGGDEFAILYPQADEKKVHHLLGRVENRLNRNALPYGVSYGFACFDKAKDFNTAYRSADKMLYENKDCFWEKYRG